MAKWIYTGCESIYGEEENGTAVDDLPLRV
jgi:hypothetical protein